MNEFIIAFQRVKRRWKRSSWKCIFINHKWGQWHGAVSNLADSKKRQCLRKGCREWDTVILKTYGQLTGAVMIEWVFCTMCGRVYDYFDTDSAPEHCPHCYAYKSYINCE